ncbi:unnamed protein product, partial [Penicillium bialowiezense]
MACPPSFDPYVLSELDHTLPPVHVSGFLTFHLREPINAIPVLEAAIARLVALLPFLGGNVAASTRVAGKENVLEVQPPSDTFFSQHPMLVVKKHDISISSEDSSSAVSYDDISNETFLPIGFESTGIDPVWRFQANLMRDGVIVSFSLNHQALDGIGAMCVIEAFAKCCQNANTDAGSLPTNPEKENNSRMAISGVARTPTKANASDESNTTEILNHSIDISELNKKPDNPVSRRLVLDGEKIQQVRKLCSEQAQPTSQGAPLSGNTIVTAILWICWIRVRFGTHDKDSHPPVMSSAGMASNIRPKMHPKLPDTYLGNAIGHAWSSLPVAQVLSTLSHLNSDTRTKAYMDSQYIGIIADAAKSLQTSVQGISSHSVRDMIAEKNVADDWAAQPVMADIHVSSLRHFNLYAVDFGSTLGKLSDFDMPECRFPGLAWVLPTRGNPRFSPWEVRLTLQPEDMVRMQKDPLLRWLSVD